MPYLKDHTIGGLTQAITSARTDLHKLETELLTQGATVATLISFAYEYADAPEGVISAKGAEMTRVMQRLLAAVGEMKISLRDARILTKRAVDAVDEAEAKRKTERAKLGA